MRLAIIGCGLIGHKRAHARGGCRLTLCCDVIQERAESLARTAPGSRATTDWALAARSPEVDIVVVSTTHDMLPIIAYEAVRAGKHVLIEKPGARSAAELDSVGEAARRSGSLVRVGFNHRYHRALRKAREIADAGLLGPLMFIRGRYGHGGRPGYEKEWRCDPEKSGGGESIDQGVHLIDLARWFLGDFSRVRGRLARFYWDMPVEDNAFMLLETALGNVAFLHAGWTEWKNLFSFEIAGRNGKIEVSGLGGSYGTERVAFYHMTPELGPPPTTIWEFPMADDSWEAEFSDFLDDIRLHRQPSPGIADAQAALRIVERLYQNCET